MAEVGEADWSGQYRCDLRAVVAAMAKVAEKEQP